MTYEEMWTKAKQAGVKAAPTPWLFDGEGFYDSDTDEVYVSPIARADKRQVLIHELIHWTGHKTRLARESFVTPHSIPWRLRMLEECIALVGERELSLRFDVPRWAPYEDAAEVTYKVSSILTVREVRAARAAIQFLNQKMGW